MTRTFKNSSLIFCIFLLTNFNAQAFILDLIKDVLILEDALSDMNRKNRDAVKHCVKVVYNICTNKREINIAENYTQSPVAYQEEQPQEFSFKDLAGEIPEDVREIVEFLDEPEKFKRLGAQMPRGVLLVGPPGTGKTSIARAIAGQAGAHFIDASASEFIEMYVGVGPKRIRDLFEKAKNAINNGPYKKAIIFIDELDAIGGSRHAGENSEYRNTLNELLNQMDGFKQNPAIMVIGATNTPDSIDSALKRPGRFDRIVEIGLPDLSSRQEILEHYAKSIKYNDKIDFNFIAQKTHNYSGAELKNLVNEAAVRAARRNAEFVNQQDFDLALKNMQTRKQYS